MEAYLRVNTGNLLCFPSFDFLLKNFLFALSYRKKGEKKKCFTDLVFPITEMIGLNKL